MHQNGKKEFYHNEFNKYKNDIRKMWDTLKEIINKKTFKSDFPSRFVHERVEIIGTKISLINSMNILLKSGPSKPNQLT